MRIPCGVWAAPSVERSPAPTTDPSGARRLIVSPTGRTGIAAPWRRAARATAETSSVGTSGRAPSWTSTISGSPPPSLDRLASRWRKPAATESWRRVPARQQQLDLPGQPDRARDRLDPLVAGHEDDPADLGRLGDGPQRVRQEREPADDGVELVDPAHPGRGARSDDDRVGEGPSCGPSCRSPPSRSPRSGPPPPPPGPSRSGPSPAPQSRRGWAKIIRPATVWRTRVTDTSRSLSM